jgi:hypothetical protein
LIDLRSVICTIGDWGKRQSPFCWVNDNQQEQYLNRGMRVVIQRDHKQRPGLHRHPSNRQRCASENEMSYHSGMKAFRYATTGLLIVAVIMICKAMCWLFTGIW